jgi:hypothetical protein
VDETEWLACTDPARMLDFLSRHGQLTERKARLFGIAVCRFGCPVTNPHDRDVAESAEEYADQSARARDLLTAELAIEDEMTAGAASAEAVEWLAETISPSWEDDKDDIAERAALVREVFTNPFQSAWLAPSCRTATVQSLAQSAYDERQLPAGVLDSDRLSVLSNALEEAGSTAELVEHLRGPGPHVRGCWVVDLCLGKS